MSSHVPRFAYFGLPLGALALMRGGFVPDVVVLGRTRAPGTRRLLRSLEPSVPRFVRPAPDDPRIGEALDARGVDTVLSWFYPQAIPRALLARATRGAFGAHPSLLPRWRGPDPTFWAIFAGDEETGVTLHRLETEYDTGAIVAQRRLAIRPDEHALALARRLDRPGLALMVHCAERLAAGDALLGTTQDEAAATDAPTPDDAFLEIDWGRPADEIARLVRAAAPYPGATAEFGDALVEVLEARPSAVRLPAALAPADAVWTPEGLVVRAGDAGLCLTKVRLEDGEIVRGDALRGLFPEGLSEVGFETGGATGASGKTKGS
ncbi:MAG: formyltransferase family protein [Polyangiales bacterium]